MKLWTAAWLLMFPVGLVGALIGAPWLFLPYGMLLGLVLMPTLNIIDGRNKNRGGNGIMYEDDQSSK